MKQITQQMKTGELHLLNVPVPITNDKFVLVRNHYSVISAGTEKTKLDLGKKSLLQKAKARPDLVKQVLTKIKTEGLLNTYRTVKTKLEEDSPLGYSCAGIVDSVGLHVEGIQPGDRVACGGAGYANHADFVAVPKNLVVKIPDNVSLQEAAFTTIGSIALQGVRLAQPQLGEKFLVIGLGLVGQLAAQLLKANGCVVFGFDVDERKVEILKQYHMQGAASSEALHQAVSTFTQNVGFDGVLICAGTASNQPVEIAAELSRSKGRVIIVGAVGMQIPREPYFKKEIALVVSRSYGPGRYDPQYEENGIDYPIDYVRFTEQRNMECFLQLLSNKSIDLSKLITHQFHFDQAKEAYGLIEGNTTELYLGILLNYQPNNKKDSGDFASQNSGMTERDNSKIKTLNGKIHLAVIGAGNYARKILLPFLSKNPHVVLQTIMTGTGRATTSLIKNFGFHTAVGSIEESLSPTCNTVLIATRHNTHAEYTIRALSSGKHVFVEKPIALTLEELAEIRETLIANPEQQLMVGFNRRFAPLTVKVKEFFASIQSPKVINIRMNAGFIPKEHWTQDPQIGGGRIIGEACHAVDLASALADSTPLSVFTTGLSDHRSPLLNENVLISLRFKNGSIANITYVSNGSKQLSKEYVEIYGGGQCAVVDDFRTATLYSETKTQKIKLTQQDKGQKALLEAWLKGLEIGIPCVDPAVLLENSLATILAVHSLAAGEPMQISN